MPFSFIGLPGEMNAFLAIPVPLNKVSRVVMKSQNNNAKSGQLMHSLSLSSGATLPVGHL